MQEVFNCPPFVAAPTLVWDSLPQVRAGMHLVLKAELDYCCRLGRPR